MIKKKEIRLNDKIHKVWIDENGERIIDGKTVDEYMKTLSFDELLQFALIGHSIVKKKNVSPQLILDTFSELKKSNN